MAKPRNGAVVIATERDAVLADAERRLRELRAVEHLLAPDQDDAR